MRRSAGWVVAGAAAGAGVALRPGTRANQELHRGLARLGRRLRYAEGRLHGVAYFVTGRRPDPDVSDDVVADRVRSALGKTERRLDLPRVHVTVEDHVVLLHGDVGSEGDARQIERVAAAVSGVSGVESYLHAGLTRGDTRPSEGHAVHQASPGLVELLSAAQDAGVDAHAAAFVVRGVLSTFADRLPAAQQRHVAAHLPADVRPLFVPPRRIAGSRPARTVHDLVGRIIMTTSGLPMERAHAVTGAVVHGLRRLVPDDAGKVAAVLPPELRALWEGASA